MAGKAARPAKLRRKIVRETVLDTPDPVDIAMAAAASGKPLPEAARSVLEKHARLIDSQARLTNAQCAELRLRKIGEGVRAALWAMLAILALVVLALIFAAVVRASRSDALIVQSFRVPVSLEAQGLTGEVVATQVLDKLAGMQATRSVRAASTYANNWDDEVKIEIPNTGASTDEIWRLLRGWLGKETRISGEVIKTAKGLALTARVGRAPGQRFVSATGDLDTLITQGAELIYRQTQPYRYAIYLSRIRERVPESNAVLKDLTADPSLVERKWGFFGLSSDAFARGNFHGAMAFARQAVAIDPKMLTARMNFGRSHFFLGHLQVAIDNHNRLKALAITDNESDQEIVKTTRCAQRGVLGYWVRDPEQVDEAAACLEAASGPAPAAAPPLRALASLLRHDARPALTFRQPQSAGTIPEQAAAQTAITRLWGEMLGGSPPAVAKALEEMDAALAQRQSTAIYPSFYLASDPTQVWPQRAEALLLLGRRAEAAELIRNTPLDCYTCVRVRGLVAKSLGDAPGAQRWFAEAARQGPRLAPAFADWGLLLTEHRRFGSAQVKLRRAAELAPNWADPLKYWGDALAAEGKGEEALDKYDAALELAPKWSELRQARDRVARR